MSFQFIKQPDAMQCGVASLAMVCTHYGKKVDRHSLNFPDRLQV
ncbi:cysteine peptidase family C39 domain-containing protein [uncultured Duncaniella sp.]